MIADAEVRARLTLAVSALFVALDRELVVFDKRTRDAARGLCDLLVEKSATRVSQMAPVPRGHCDRCDRCGWPLEPENKAACHVGDCSQRPCPARRDVCAGCGAPFEEEKPAPGPPQIDATLLCATCFRRDTTTVDDAGNVHCAVCGNTTPAPTKETRP